MTPMQSGKAEIRAQKPSLEKDMLGSPTLKCVIQNHGQISALGSALSGCRIPEIEKSQDQMLSSQFLVSFYAVQKKINIHVRDILNELCNFDIL